MTTTHEHDHAQGAGPTRLAVALALTSTVLLGEVVVGWLSGSLSLLADAGHMATDSAGLVVALLAAHLASRPSTDRSTWGMRRSEVIGAALQAGMLSLVGVTVAVRAVLNLVRPETIHADGMLVMGVIGLAANLASLLVLSGGHAASLNMRAAILEVTGDALGSLGVIVAGFVIRLTGWVQADAVASLLIAALIVPRAGALLRAAGRVLMDFTTWLRSAVTWASFPRSWPSTTCTPGGSPATFRSSPPTWWSRTPVWTPDATRSSSMPSSSAWPSTSPCASPTRPSRSSQLVTASTRPSAARSPGGNHQEVSPP